MLPTMFRSSPRSISSSTRIPDSSVATRVSYGAAFTTISLLAFCIALPAAGDQLRRHLSRNEPLGGQRHPQQGSGGLQRPDALSCALDDCNGDALRVHLERANDRLQVDLGGPVLPCEDEGVRVRRAECGEALRGPPGRGLLGQGKRRDRTQGPYGGDIEVRQPGGAGRDARSKGDTDPRWKVRSQFYRYVTRRDGEGELGLEKLDVALRPHGEGGGEGKFRRRVEPLAVRQRQAGPPEDASPQGLDLQAAQVFRGSLLGIGNADDLPLRDGGRWVRCAFPSLIRHGGIPKPSRVGDVRQSRGARPAGGADRGAAIGRRLPR